MTAFRIALWLSVMVGVGSAQTFSTRTETVRIDVSVRQDGHSVAGLTADDFEVFDNGVRQTISLVSGDQMPVNVALALDMSGSVQGARLDRLRQAGQRIIGMLQPHDTASLVIFSDRAVVAVDTTSDPAVIAAALESSAPGIDTALFDAAHAAMVLGAPLPGAIGRSLVIIFGDGQDTASFLSPTIVVDTARRLGPVVYAVSSQQSDPDRFLENLTRLTGGRRIDVSSLNRVSDAFAEILTELRERYLVGYSPTGVARGGWHDLRVRVRGQRAEVRARAGYVGPPNE